MIRFPKLSLIGDNLDMIFRILHKRGYPKWSIEGSLYYVPLGSTHEMAKEAFKNLVSVGTTLDLAHCIDITNLSSLEKVGGNLNIRYTNIKTLPELKYVGHSFNARNTKINKIEDLPKLEHAKMGVYVSASNFDTLEDREIFIQELNKRGIRAIRVRLGS